MIRCSTSLLSGKHLRSFLLKKKISTAIGERRSADCSRLFPPCYSFGSHGHEIEEKTSDQEEIRSGKIESSEIHEDRQGCQASACGGEGPPARGGASPDTGRR